MHMYNNEVKNIAECNLLHDIANHPKRAKNANSHYYPIIHGCMNNRKGKAKFKNFHILLENVFSSTIVMGRLFEKIFPEKDTPMQWHTQARHITSNIKVKVDFTLPALRATNVVTWKCHGDKLAKVIYNMILGRYLLT